MRKAFSTSPSKTAFVWKATALALFVSDMVLPFRLDITDIPDRAFYATVAPRSARRNPPQSPISLASFGNFDGWCPGKDSNLHGLHRWYLKPVRLPIPPPGHAALHKGGRGGLSMLAGAFHFPRP